MSRDADIQRIVDIQLILRVRADGIWGPKSQGALDVLAASIAQDTTPALTPPPIITRFHGKASSFADPADVKAFEDCKAEGKTDQECFKVGDNGIGFWGDSTVEGTGPSCAVTPEAMIARWGEVAHARFRLVQVDANGHSAIVVVKDTMPHEANVTNGAVIDLNPDACRELRLTPPVLVDAAWRWFPA
jgi:hypothetical protein